MKRSEELGERLKAIIIGTCNTIGCDKCDLKWGSGNDCSATELQSKIFDAEAEERSQNESMNLTTS